MNFLEKFYIGVNCFPGNDKYKFKRLLASLLMKPKNNFDDFITEANFIKDTFLSVPDGSISEMITFLISKGFEICGCVNSLTVEFLVDGLHEPKAEILLSIIEEFKKFHNKVIISGTKQHTSLTVNRNIFLKNHKFDYVCFCDDDDLSCSIDTKCELLALYLSFIFHKIQVNSDNLIEMFSIVDNPKQLKLLDVITKIKNANTNNIIELSDEFRKLTYEFLKELPTKDAKALTVDGLKLMPYQYSTDFAKKFYYALSFFGPHFFTTYSEKNKSYGFSYGFWSLIIPPYMIDNFTNVKEVKNEDIVYDLMHNLISRTSGTPGSLTILGTKPIYFYLSPSFNDYKDVKDTDVIASLSNAMMFSMHRKFKFPQAKFDYDSIVEYIRDEKITLEFVADRDFRGYTVEDVKNIFQDDFERWNEFIRQYNNFLCC